MAAGKFMTRNGSTNKIFPFRRVNTKNPQMASGRPTIRVSFHIKPINQLIKSMSAANALSASGGIELELGSTFA